MKIQLGHAERSLRGAANSAVCLYQKECSDAGIVGMPFFQSELAFDEYRVGGNEDIMEVRIAGLPLIDTERLTWDQIIELR